MPGKTDWSARGLPIEGDDASAAAVGSISRDDVVTCGLTDPVGEVRARVEASPYRFGLAVTGERVLLGRLRGSALRDAPDESPAEAIMEPGPSTVRPDLPAADVAQSLAEADLQTALVSTPEGRLIGVARRSELAGGAQSA